MYSSSRESVEFLTETVHLSHSYAQGLAIGSHPNLTLPTELSAHKLNKQNIQKVYRSCKESENTLPLLPRKHR